MPNVEPRRLRIGVLSSPNGTSTRVLRALNLICAVVSEDAEANILKYAKQSGIAAKHIPFVKKQRAQFESAVTQFFAEQQIDLILLVGYMHILSDDFVNRWYGKILNVHPSLLPAFAGGMDLDVHQLVIEAGCTESGCTVHFVTPGKVDTGPIYFQSKCRVFLRDTKDDLKARVQYLEAETLVIAVAAFSQNPNACEDLLNKRIFATIIQPVDMRSNNWFPAFKMLPKTPEFPSTATCLKISMAMTITGVLVSTLRNRA